MNFADLTCLQGLAEQRVGLFAGMYIHQHHHLANLHSSSLARLEFYQSSCGLRVRPALCRLS